MSPEIWAADAMMVGVVMFMVLSWAFEPKTQRASARAVKASPQRR
ncbi:MAG TPA: hypothetical protein VN805_14935 [Caulobacteraceae bacterium]|nr:hypothetical protein [Caulobacteraceae bacterium]